MLIVGDFLYTIGIIQLCQFRAKVLPKFCCLVLRVKLLGKILSTTYRNKNFRRKLLSSFSLLHWLLEPSTKWHSSWIGANWSWNEAATNDSSRNLEAPYVLSIQDSPLHLLFCLPHPYFSINGEKVVGPTKWVSHKRKCPRAATSAQKSGAFSELWTREVGNWNIQNTIKISNPHKPMNGEQRKQCLRENKETNMQTFLPGRFRNGFSCFSTSKTASMFGLHVKVHPLTMNDITCDETVIRPNSVMPP